MKKIQIQSITYAGIFAAIYAVITLLSTFFPIVDGFILVVMPIFSAYYSTKFRIKETILFNLVSLILCFLLSYGDPFYSLIYILPTLIVGDIFGLLIKIKTKFYSCFLLISLAYFITNLLTLYLTKIIYDLDLIYLIFSTNDQIINNFSWMILFFLSIIEAILCISIINNELKKINIKLIKENINSILFEILFIISFTFLFIFKFISLNFYYFIFILTILLFIPSIIYSSNNLKYKSLIFFLVNLFYIFALIPIKNNLDIPLLLLTPILIIEIAILTKKLYNNKKLEENIDKG